jgi:hypothetical protein
MENHEKHLGQEPEPKGELNNGNGLHCPERNASFAWNFNCETLKKWTVSDSKLSSGKVGADLTLQQNGDAKA